MGAKPRKHLARSGPKMRGGERRPSVTLSRGSTVYAPIPID
ncbi:hypothetical protein PUN4_660075 [Paraburkholderia unamae]|nr:hypothetical protein PUN4_660075 [Paraburkholderia unamae]